MTEDAVLRHLEDKISEGLSNLKEHLDKGFAELGRRLEDNKGDLEKLENRVFMGENAVEPRLRSVEKTLEGIKVKVALLMAGSSLVGAGASFAAQKLGGG